MSQTTANSLRDPAPYAAADLAHQGAARLSGFGAGNVMRVLCFCLGMAFFVTSVGLWAFTAPDASVMLIKLGASILFLGGAAVFLMVAIAPYDFYRLEFDRRTGELRMLERDGYGQFNLMATQPVADIDKLRFEGGALRAWNAQGAVVMSVPMRARHAKSVLNAVLKAG
ncbi:MAG: hypothetical protein AAGL23_06385 [Pseudomonadota bacterium]